MAQQIFNTSLFGFIYYLFFNFLHRLSASLNSNNLINIVGNILCIHMTNSKYFSSSGQAKESICRNGFHGQFTKAYRYNANVQKFAPNVPTNQQKYRMNGRGENRFLLEIDFLYFHRCKTLFSSVLKVLQLAIERNDIILAIPVFSRYSPNQLTIEWTLAFGKEIKPFQFS